MNDRTIKAANGSDSIRIVASTWLAHPGGLHARPAIRISQLAKRFESRVWIALSDGGPWVDAKSVARVIAMKMPANQSVFFAAEGGDASDAVVALVGLVDADFEDGATDAR